MHVVVVNCGSTSLKAECLDPESGERVASVHVDRIGTEVPDHAAALAIAVERLGGHELGAVAHRVVHGGERFVAPTRIDGIDGTVIAELEKLIPLAPLHVPNNLLGIRAALKAWPNVPHIAVFDTAVHASLPRRARSYALPRELAERHGIRRYGFHGPSHHWVAHRAADFLQVDITELRLITCHLGGGCSVTAWDGGSSIETSMGMTPLEGLVMATRSGDVDPGALIALARAEGLDLDGLDALLNNQSGLLGLGGSKDLRDLEDRAAGGDEDARLAIAVFAHRVRKYIGAYAAVLGGVDAIVFTGGIGENGAAMRGRIAQGLEFLGARLDLDANRLVRVGVDNDVASISQDRGRCRLLVVRTDENRSMAQDAAAVASGRDQITEAPPIPVKISARHVHLTQAHVEVLFGPGHKLTPKKDLGQPDQYVCEERVAIVGPKATLERVGIIGPPRPSSQVEVSRTDEFTLGVDAPVRLSGDHRSTPGITLRGPEGEVTLESGLICAWRHIHMRPEHAVIYGVKHGDLVEVELDTESRDLVLRDVMVRVSPASELEMHIDTDEANAADLGRDAVGLLSLTKGQARLMRRDVSR